MTAEYKNWQEEFVDINFTDQRLKSRFFKIIDAFAASPGKSTWAATGSRSSAKGQRRTTDVFNNKEGNTTAETSFDKCAGKKECADDQPDRAVAETHQSLTGL